MESEPNKSRKMAPKADVIARNSIFDVDSEIANRSDRPRGRIGAPDHGKWTYGGATEGTCERLGANKPVGNAPTPPIEGQKTPRGAAGTMGESEIPKIDNQFQSE
jgi:hypothetical protein